MAESSHAELTELEALKTFDCDKNPITNPPHEIWRKGLAAILAFFRDGLRSGTAENRTLKVVVLGRSEAGKTSLLNVLRGEAAGYGSVHGTLMGLIGRGSPGASRASAAAARLARCCLGSGKSALSVAQGCRIWTAAACVLLRRLAAL